MEGDNVDSTPEELADVFNASPFARAYGINYAPEEEIVPNKPVIPGFIMVTPAAEGYDPYLINVATIQTVNPARRGTGPDTGVRTHISHDAENFESVKETFEEVLLLMAASLN